MHAQTCAISNGAASHTARIKTSEKIHLRHPQYLVFVMLAPTHTTSTKNAGINN